MAAPEEPFAIHSDGSAKDPIAFQKALQQDQAKMKALEAEQEVYKTVMSGDVEAFQKLLRSAFAVRLCGTDWCGPLRLCIGLIF